MANIASILRRLVLSDDRSRAFEAERRSMEQATRRSPVDHRFSAEMRNLAKRPEGSVLIGTSSADPSIEVRIAWPDIVGAGHALVLGGSGSGKTRAVGAIVREILRRTANGRPPCNVVILDHKSEFVDLSRKLLSEILRALPSDAANRVLDDLVVMNPFSATALVPMQILKPEAGVIPEIQAFEITSLVDRLGGADLGVRQDSFLFHAVLLGITRALSLPELAGLLSDPAALASAAATSSSAEVREFFGARAGATRLAATSLEGVRARLHRLLRLPSTRLMLGARDSISFRSLLDRKIVFVDVGSPPLGCEDLGRFWSGLVMLKLTRAIFERRPEDAACPVAVFVDEWQEGLGAGGDMAEHYERVLSMARSRSVSFWLISQSLAGAAKVSASLPKMVATNTNLQLLFRASPEDARAMAHLLPVTGRRTRPPSAPWLHEKKSPFLTPQEELISLTNGVTSLPDRTFYLWNRKRPYRAELVRAVEVAPPESRTRDDGLERSLRDGALAVPIATLELQAAGADGFWPIPATTQTADATLPMRRPRPVK